MFTFVIAMGEEKIFGATCSLGCLLGEGPIQLDAFQEIKNPFFASLSRLYCSLVQDGKRESSILMYSYQSRGAVK